MNDSNKAIAARINKELKNRGWKQSKLLKKILEFKNPNLSKEELYKEALRKKGNFSTTLKGTSARTIPKEELYIISKIVKFGQQAANWSVAAHATGPLGLCGQKGIYFASATAAKNVITGTLLNILSIKG